MLRIRFLREVRPKSSLKERFPPSGDINFGQKRTIEQFEKNSPSKKLNDSFSQLEQQNKNEHNQLIINY